MHVRFAFFLLWTRDNLTADREKQILSESVYLVRVEQEFLTSVERTVQVATLDHLNTMCVCSVLMGPEGDITTYPYKQLLTKVNNLPNGFIS